MQHTPDYSEAFEQVTPGSYKCKVIDVEARMSKNNNRFLSWKLEVQPSGMHIFHNTMLEGKGSGMLKHFLKCALGEGYKDGAFDTDTIIGKMLVVDLQNEEVQYQGQMREFLRVKKIEQLTAMNEPKLVEEDVGF